MKSEYDCQYARNKNTKGKVWRDGQIRARFLGGCVRISLYEPDTLERIGASSIDSVDIFNVLHDKLEGREISSEHYIIKVMGLRCSSPTTTRATPLVKRALPQETAQARPCTLGVCRHKFKKYQLSSGREQGLQGHLMGQTPVGQHVVEPTTPTAVLAPTPPHLEDQSLPRAIGNARDTPQVRSYGQELSTQPHQQQPLGQTAALEARDLFASILSTIDHIESNK